MEDLYYQQCELSNLINKLPINIKKDSAERKSDDYFKRRLELLEKYWSEYQNNHLAICKYGVKDHMYFANSEHEKVSKVYTAAIALIKEQRQQFLSNPIKTTRSSQPTPEERETAIERELSDYEQPSKSSILHATESRGSSSKLDDMYRKQAANFKAFKRSIAFIDVESMSEKWEMEDALKTIEARWSKIDSLHWELDSEIGEEDVEYEAVFTKHEQSYNKLKLMINKKLSSVSHREHSAPKMEIPEFSGRFQNWSSFKDLFIETIHNNPAFSKAQKMQFLKGKVKGEAERLIQHLAISTENYDACWEILNHRFNNERLIFISIMNNLLGLPNAQQRSFIHIKKLHDVTLESTHAIRNLGIDISTWDPILVYLITQKLDSETYDDYNDFLKNKKQQPVLKDFLNFLESKFTGWETSRRRLDQVTPKNNNIQSNGDKSFYQKPKRYSPNFVNRFDKQHSFSKALHVSTIKCQFCGQQHALFNCEKILGLQNEAKLNAISKLKLCKNCLFNHNGQQCISVKRCRNCGGNHHSVLHDACSKNMSQSTHSSKTAATIISTEENVPINAHISHNGPGTNEVLLATTLIKVAAIDGSYHILRALIDPGSQVSLIRESAAKKLGLPRSKFNGLIVGVGEIENNCKGVVTLNCSSTYNNFKFSIDVLVMKNLLKDLPLKTFDTSKWSHLTDLKLADPDFSTSRPVDLLLSAQVNGLILLEGLIKGESLSQPILQETHLGWVIYGGGDMPSYQCNVVINNINEMQQFWEIEDISEKSSLSEEDQQCVDFYLSSTKRRKDGRYVVRLPLKPDINEKLGTSKEMAIAQFQNLERKFKKQPILAEQYKAFISEYIALGHMVPSYSSNNNGLSCYLPHHSVQRAESATTKLRVVFNASARTSTGYSVNDLMFKGPNLQQDLQELVLKWRQYRYAFTSDIEKMYRQILVCKDDQRYQQVLWRENQDKPLQTYNLTTVTYGTKPGSFLAMMTLRQLASDERIRFPTAAKVLEESCYVDDVVHGSHSIPEGQRLIEDLNSLLKAGGFTLRKWCVSHPDLLNYIGNKSSDGEIIFNFKSEGTLKTLGLRWNSHSDKFTFNYNTANTYGRVTKRLLLSEISKLFDPLGWLSPITTKLKLIFQKLWSSKTDWDEEVPESIKREWIAISGDMSYINQCEIPRWIGYRPNKDVELHGYCDASTKAYAAVIYARLQQENEPSVILVIAKARLAPISKSVSLPRLELCGAYLLAKLMGKVVHCLSNVNTRIFGWTDSMVVLGWLHGEPGRWKPFVANRTKIITETMKPSCWRYVPSKENPADVASRGISASLLKNQTIWWQGPQSLKLFYEKDSNNVIYTTNQETKTKPSASTVNSAQNGDAESIIALLLSRHSSFRKVSNIVGWLLRAIKTITLTKTATVTNKRHCLPGFLTLGELKKANLLILKYIQRTEFYEEIKYLRNYNKLPSNSHLLKLNPFLNKEGILRVGGRLSNSHMSIEMKHPAILPHNSRLTTLLIQQAHQLTFHGGPRLTLFNLRQKYWIISGSKAVKKEVNNCVICRKHNPKLQAQLMGDLPEARSNPAPPFYHTGVDYTGYVEVKSNKGRGIKTTKGYIALFICMATKAIHLELVSDLSSSGFLAALRRMAARRGAPRHIYSDNGTNFVGANRMLEESYHDFINIHDNNFYAELAELNIEWHFNAPSWPSAGGLWERAVRSLKHHLKRILGDHKLTYEEFITILAQVEACLNSRPLCALSENIEDLNVLTPAHFLMGRSGTTVIETERDARTRWYLSMKLVNDIWKRWRIEYLTQLSIRSKWKSVERNMNVGDLVTIQDDNLPPGKWIMGRIVDTHQGQDDLIRVVTLRTKGGLIKRPVVKLSKLPIAPDTTEIEKEIISDHKGIKPQKSAYTGYRSKFASLAISLICFMCLLTPLHSAFNISKLPSNNSLYFEPIDDMQVIRDKWRLIVYYDMNPYWEGNAAATKFLQYLGRLCSRLNDKSHCNTTTLQLNHDYTEIQHYNKLMLNQHFNSRNRRRRGLINGIGYVANSLFGVLDERFAEQYKKDILLVKRNEQHLASLLRNQTSVIEAEYNILKRTERTILLQHKTINKHLNQLDNAAVTLGKEIENLAKSQDYLLSLITANSLIQNLRRIQDTLLGTITDIHHGEFDTHLLTPSQLQQELQFISGQLSKDVTLPVDNIQTDLRYVYNMLKVRTRMTEEFLIFEITFPLTSRDSYKIYEILPVPKQLQSDMISVLPVAEFVAVNLRKDAFFTMSFVELQLCLRNEYSYLCQINKPINHLYIEEKFCKLDSKLQQCSVIKSPCQDTWQQLNDRSRYFYFCCNNCAVRIMCQDQVTFEHMTGAGVIDLDSKCIVKGRHFTLYSHSELTNRVRSNSYIPTPQIAELNYIVNVSLHHYTDYADPLNSTLVDLGEQIEQLKSANTNSFDDTLSTHDIHQYAICYGLLSITAILAAYLLWKKRRAVSSVEISSDVTKGVVFSRKQSTADRQPSEVVIISERTQCKQDKATSPMVKKCRFTPEV